MHSHVVNQEHQAQQCGVADVNDYWGPGPGPGFVVSRWNLKVFKNLARVLRARAAA